MPLATNINAHHRELTTAVRHIQYISPQTSPAGSPHPSSEQLRAVPEPHILMWGSICRAYTPRLLHSDSDGGLSWNPDILTRADRSIIIAGPGYDALTAEGIHLNVAAGSSTAGGSLGDEVPCAMMEGVAAYTQTEPEGSQPSTLDPTAVADIETKKGLGAALVKGCGGAWEGEGEEGPRA